MGFRKDFLDCLSGLTPEKPPLTEYMMFWPECDALYLPHMNGKSYAEYFGLGSFLSVPCDFNPYPLYEEEILSQNGRFLSLIHI